MPNKFYHQVLHEHISEFYRDFIENHLLEFTRNNPGVVVYLQPRRHHAPYLVAEYCKYFIKFKIGKSVVCRQY